MAHPDASQLKLLLEPARSLVLLLPQNPDFDMVAAALSLKLGLQEATNKSIMLCSPDEVTVEFNRLVGVNTIQNTFGSRSLVISFGNQTEYVDKVSYNLDHGELQLVVAPKSSSPDLDPQKLKFVSSAGQADVYIFIGVDSFEDLGSFAQPVKQMFTNSHSVSLTVAPPETPYATFSFSDPQSSSLSELATHLLLDLKIPISEDMATNLFSGLEESTDNFRSPQTTARTFETAAQLKRAGAKREQPLSPDNFPPGSIPGTPPPTPSTPPQSPPSVSPTSSGWGTDSQTTETSATSQSPSPDWLEPKIYQGHTLS